MPFSDERWSTRKCRFVSVLHFTVLLPNQQSQGEDSLGPMTMFAHSNKRSQPGQLHGVERLELRGAVFQPFTYSVSNGIYAGVAARIPSSGRCSIGSRIVSVDLPQSAYHGNGASWSPNHFKMLFYMGTEHRLALSLESQPALVHHEPDACVSPMISAGYQYDINDPHWY